MAGITTIKLPRVSGLPPVPIFVGEGQPGPAMQWTFANTTLGPVRKILVMAAVSGELQMATPETASAVIARVLSDAVSKSIDTIGFDANAGDTIRPPGLLNGVTPLAAAAASGDAMANDIGNLLGAIAAAGIDAGYTVFVGGAREIGIMRAKLGPEFSNSLLTTLGLPAKSLAAFAPAALSFGYRGEVEIQTAFEPALHMEETTPADIGTPGSPNVVAAPVKSMFQTDLLSIRVRANCAWCVMPGGAQVVENVNW
jgi:hypothetical protein